MDIGDRDPGDAILICSICVFFLDPTARACVCLVLNTGHRVSQYTGRTEATPITLPTHSNCTTPRNGRVGKADNFYPPHH